MRRTLSWAGALLLLATLAGACAAPTAASVVRVPDSVLWFLDAAQNKDLGAFLDAIALDEVAGGEDVTLMMYDVWFASADDLTWQVASVQARSVGGQTVVVDVDAHYLGVDDSFTLAISTNREGRIVSWQADRPQLIAYP